MTQRTARHGRDRTERTGSSRRLVWAITAESFFTRLGFGIVTFALPLYALRLGMSLTQIGLLIGMKAIIEPTVKPLMGRVVDRWGVRPGYLAAVLVRCVASVLLIFAATPLALFAVRALQGAASAARDPASISALTRTSRARLGRTFSLTFSARDLGNVSAGALGGGLLAVTGGEFTVLWAVVAVLAVLPVVIVWVGVPSDPGPGRPDAGDRHGASRAPDRWRPSPVPRPRPGLFRDRRLRLLCGLGLLCGLTAHMTHGLLPVLAVTVAGLSAAQIGFIYSCSVVALLLVGPLAGWVADRFGSDKLTGVRGLANAASSVTYLVFPSFAGMLCGRLIDDAGKAAFRPAWGTLLAESARRAGPRAGRVTAGLDTALSIGEALGPLLAALLWDVWGLAAYLLTRAALGIGTELLITRRLRARPIPRAAHSDLRQRPPWQRPPRTPRGHRASGQHRTAPVTTGADPGRQQADGDVTGDR